MSQQRRKSYNLEFKKSAVQEAIKSGNRAAARTFNVHEKTIRTWRKQEAEIGE